MHDVGLVMEQLADAVADEIPHDAGALRLGVSLDCGTDIAGGPAGAGRGDARVDALVGDFDQPLGLPTDLADGVHAR